MLLAPPVDGDDEDDDATPSGDQNQVNGSAGLCLTNLRGVRWRIGLGILPSSHSSSVDDFRKAVADSRRRYASLRYRLLMDSQNNSPNFSIDNPLSQNPDSLWVHFFRNAELEKMVEQDLSRLYPEQGSFFQTPAFQTMIRRVLISWCLLHPEHGYKQGMHELLAPLLYVLHVDMQHLLDVRKNNVDHFVDELDWVSFPSTSILSNYVLRKSKKWDDLDDELNGFHKGTTKHKSLDDLDPETRDIILLSDSYGPEGELGILMSERFMEHDAYCIFDALMSGGNGVVAIADFFSPIPAVGSRTGLSPVIEASTAIYHLLSVLDSSLHGHLVALGVESQYFSLRWLRVLYAREFQLENLLVMWDEIFSTPNDSGYLDTKQDQQPYFKILASARGVFITTMSVSMILHLRSSLLATQNATSCLQKLLNFPDNVDLKMLIEKANSFQALAFGTNFNLSSYPCEGFAYMDKSLRIRDQGLLLGHVTLKAPPSPIPENYWEEKWSLSHKREHFVGIECDPFFNVIKGFCRERLGIFGTLMNLGPSKNVSSKEGFLHSLSQNMFSGQSQKSNVVGYHADSRCDEVSDPVSKVSITKELNVEDNGYFIEGSCVANITEKPSEHFFLESSANNTIEDTTSLNVDNTMFSAMTCNLSRSTDHDSERCRVDSNSVNFVNKEEIDSKDVSFCNSSVAEANTDISGKLLEEDDNTVKQGPVSKEKKLLPGKFQWLWKLGRDPNQKIQEEEGTNDMIKSAPDASGVNGKMESDEHEVMGADLRNLGKIMLENIQVVESALHQEDCEVARNIEIEEQAHAMKSIKELRKISHLLLDL